MFGSGSGGFSFGGSSSGGSGLGGGSSSTGNTGGGFSFGSSNNNNTSTGNAGSSASPFGGSASTAAPASTSGGFSFGGANNNTASTQPSTGGGLFGAKSAATSGGLFGSNSNTATTQPASTTSGGLFGSKPAAPSTTVGGLFGSNNTTSTQPTTGGGLFGSSNTQTQPNTGGGLFGNTNQSQPSTGGGLFGSSNTSSNANTNTSGGLFANTQSNTAQPASTTTTTQSSQPSFAWSQPSSSQQNSNLQQQQQPLSFASNTSQDPNANSNYSVTIQEQLAKVKNSWDPTSQQTTLKTFFYNTVPENQSALYTKPANENEEWDKAYANKPSNNSIPVRAVGFGDLQKRSQTQINHVAQARVILQQISEKNKMLSDKHDLDTASRIIAAKARHSRISKRILRLVSTLAVLKSKGYQLSPNEEKLIQTFQELLEKSQDPSGLGKSNELWARLAVLKEKAKSLSDQLDNTLGIQKLDNNNVDDINDSEQKQEQILKIAQVLQQQQNGIKYLSEIIEGDEKTIQKFLK